MIAERVSALHAFSTNSNSLPLRFPGFFLLRYSLALLEAVLAFLFFQSQCIA
ncbi:hypothetical protein PC128_g19244 [Phytophthora cactorum]|nr:hypothetical protein PC128_g19244 [Phytophthora cactorum]